MIVSSQKLNKKTLSLSSMLRTSKLHMITKIVHDQPYHQRFSNKIEAVQYNAALAIKNAIKETSRAKLYKELGIESLGFSQ